MREATTTSTRRAGRKRTLAAVVAGLIMFAGVATLNAAEPATEPPTESRVVRAFAKPWKTVCRGDVCRPANVFALRFRTPPGVETTDVSATITFNYRTTPLDYAIAELFLDAEGDTRLVRMSPGGFTLQSTSRTGASQTLTWIRRGIAARGRTYTLGFVVDPRGGPPSKNGAPPLAVYGTNVAVIVQMS